jgi:hypothetical protein
MHMPTATTVDKLVNFNISELNEKITAILSHIEFAEEIDFDSCKIYCNKTGKYLASISTEEYRGLLHIHGSKRAQELLIVSAMQYTHPLWLHTDAKALEKLKLIDPIGYFIYAISRVYNRVYMKETYTQHNPKFEKEIKFARFQFVVCLRKQIETAEIPIAEIHEINEFATRYLSIVHTGKVGELVKFSKTSVEKLTTSIIRADLIANLRRIGEYCVKHRIANPYTNASDGHKLQAKFGGYSNFRQQAKFRGFLDHEIFSLQIGEILNKEAKDAKIKAATVGYRESRYGHGQMKRTSPVLEKPIKQNVITPKSGLQLFRKLTD